MSTARTNDGVNDVIDVVELLKQDHRSVEQRLKELDMAGAGACASCVRATRWRTLGSASSPRTSRED